MVQLFADPYGLQGNNQNLQGGSGATLQPAGNPYGPIAPIGPVAPVAAPPVAPKPAPVAAQPQIIDLSGKYGLSGTTVYRKGDNYALSEPEFFKETGLNSWTGVKLDTAYAPVASQQNAAAPVATPASVDPNQELARNAAQAGLSVSDYLQLISGQNGVTEDDLSTIRKNLGIDQLEEQVFAPPSKSTEQIYQEAYNQAGLAELKTKIADLDKRIAEKKAQFTTKEGEINENPWLSEASRVGRVGRLNAQAEAEVGNLLDEYDQYAKLYNQGLEEVNGLVTRVSTEFSANQNMNAQKLQYLLQKAEEQAKVLQSKKASSVYTYLPDFLAAKVKSQKPETIGSAQTGFYSWDPSSGTFSQVIAPQMDLTDDQKEYAMYIRQGGQGSFIDFKRGMANLKARASGSGSGLGTDLSNTMKMLQIQLLTQQLTGTKPLSGEAAKLKGIADTVVPELERLKTAFETDYKGSVRGVVVGTNRELSKLVDNVADKIGRLRSGGAINKDEESRFKNQIASWKDLAFGNKDQAIKALDGILAEALTVQRGVSPYQSDASSTDPAALAALLGGVQIN